MRILIIRHGDPDYAHDSLTEKGFREVNLLAEKLKDEPISDIYCSPLGRAQRTAEPTANALGKEIVTLDWLREFDGVMRDAEGKAQIPWNLEPRFWTNQREFYDIHTWLEQSNMSAESVPQRYKRATDSLDALLSSYGYERDGVIYKCERNRDETIALFCHFGLGTVLISHLTGISPVLLWQSLFLPTSSVTTFVTEERVKGEVVFKCMQVGDTSHLYAGGEPISRSGLFPEFFQQ
jgi:probable phosphoglycerate mutase